MTAPLDAKVELHDAVTLRFTNGAIGTMGGASSHLGGANNRHAVEVRAVGGRGSSTWTCATTCCGAIGRR